MSTCERLILTVLSQLHKLLVMYYITSHKKIFQKFRNKTVRQLNNEHQFSLKINKGSKRTKYRQNLLLQHQKHKKKQFIECCTDCFADLLGMSPDVNHFENLWFNVKFWLCQYHYLTTKEFPFSTLKSLVDHTSATRMQN